MPEAGGNVTKALTGDTGGLVQAGMILLPLLLVLRPQDESHGRLRQKQVQEDLHPRHSPWGLVLWHLGVMGLSRESVGMQRVITIRRKNPAIKRRKKIKMHTFRRDKISASLELQWADLEERGVCPHASRPLPRDPGGSAHRTAAPRAEHIQQERMQGAKSHLHQKQNVGKLAGRRVTLTNL